MALHKACVIELLLQLHFLRFQGGVRLHLSGLNGGVRLYFSGLAGSVILRLRLLNLHIELGFLERGLRLDLFYLDFCSRERVHALPGLLLLENKLFSTFRVFFRAEEAFRRFQPGRLHHLMARVDDVA